MPSTRPTVDPVLDILEEMGYDFDELDGDGYKRSLKEAIIKLTIKNPKDPRIGILTLEFQKVKGSRKVEPKEKNTRIRGDKLMGREPKKDAPSPTAGKPKLLPGSGKFNTDDVKPADVDKKQKDSSDLKPDKLDSIAKTVESIALLLRRQFNLEKKQQRDSRRQQSKADRDAREDKLETKPDGKTGLIPKAIKKPALNFFEKLKRFFLNIVIGAGVMKLFEWLKDPANAEKIAKFKDFLINNAGWILGGLAAIALLPIAIGLVSVVQGLLAGLALLGPLLPLLPKILAVLLIGAVAWWIGKKVTNKLQEAISGGGEFSNLDKLAKEDLEKHGLRRMRNLGSGEHSAELVGDDGKPIYVNRYGKDSLTGREWKKGDAGGPTYREELTIGNPLHEAYIKKTMGEEKLNTLKAATDRYNKTIFERKDPLKKEMGKEIRDSKKEFTDMRRAERKELGLSWKEKRKYDDETERLWAEKEDKIRLKYDKLVKKEFPEYYSNINSSATIDKDVKTNTEVPGHSTKKKGDNIILDGGKGNQQASSVGGSGTGGSSGTPKIGSQDPNNYLTVSTMAMYNMVGA